MIEPAPALGRAAFLGLASASVVASTAGTAIAAGAADAATPRGGRQALILAGGANRGAYEAGVIGGLVAAAGLRDGQPLPYQAVCGTSIGALNGFFVATAQYSALRKVWREIAGANIFALKPEYERIKEPSSGVMTRAYEAVSLGLGLTKNVTGILDRSRIERFLTKILDPAAPVHIPLYVSTTNLSLRKGETFVRRATTPAGIGVQRQNDALINAFLPQTVRAIADDELVRVLLASSSMPILIDPVRIAGPNGGPEAFYVDGGVSDNVPLEIGRRCAAQLHIVLVDEARTPSFQDYNSALQIGLGVFETMQQRILEYQALLAIAESAISPTPLTEAAGLRALPIEPTIIRPQSPLPGGFGDFNNLVDLDEMWLRGYNDGVGGWPAFDQHKLAEVVKAS